jgi:hypothetical protein
LKTCIFSQENFLGFHYEDLISFLSWYPLDLQSSGSLGSLCSSEDLCWSVLDWALRSADGGGAGNSRGAEVTSVSRLGNGVGNSLVGPGDIWSVTFPRSSSCHFVFLAIFDSLAVALVGTEGDLVLKGSWALSVVRLLGKKSDTSLLAWDNTDGLSI